MTCFDQWATDMAAKGYGPVAWGPAWTVHGIVIHPPYVPRLHSLAEGHRTNLQVQHARNLLAAERFEDAAKIYESLGMWNEAGEARRSGKRSVVTQVQVDVNSQIDQMRVGGITTSYACPTCGSPVVISSQTDAGSLRHCQHCGSAIQTTDLVEFLSRVVGYR